MPRRILIAALALSAAVISATTVFAGAKPEPGVEVQMIVTAADHMNHKPPALTPADITIMDGTITDWVPLDADRDLELFFLIDDSANYDFGSKLEDLRRFIASQPGTVSMGVAWIHDGALQVVENPTTDHQRASRALRAPPGSNAANPYGALSQLIASWPGNGGLQKKFLRREIVLISAGIDDSATGNAVYANAETAIQDAERAGILIYALYNPARDYLSEKWSTVDSGLINLASLSYETGGEAYFTGHEPLKSIEPFLADITEHLAHQYLVKFRLASVPESGFQTIFVASTSPDQELMKPERIWIPAAAEQAFSLDPARGAGNGNVSIRVPVAPQQIQQ